MHRSPAVPTVRALARILILVALPCLLAATSAGATTYYSKGSLAPNLLSSWSTLRNGTGAAPATFTGASDLFVVQGPHSMTTTSDWPAAGTIHSVEIEDSGTLTANHPVSVAVFTVDDRAFYVHNFASPGGGDGLTADFPGSTSRTLGLTSSVTIL